MEREGKEGSKRRRGRHQVLRAPGGTRQSSKDLPADLRSVRLGARLEYTGPSVTF